MFGPLSDFNKFMQSKENKYKASGSELLKRLQDDEMLELLDKMKACLKGNGSPSIFAFDEKQFLRNMHKLFTSTESLKAISEDAISKRKKGNEIRGKLKMILNILLNNLETMSKRRQRNQGLFALRASLFTKNELDRQKREKNKAKRKRGAINQKNNNIQPLHKYLNPDSTEDLPTEYKEQLKDKLESSFKQNQVLTNKTEESLKNNFLYYAISEFIKMIKKERTRNDPKKVNLSSLARIIARNIGSMSGYSGAGPNTKHEHYLELSTKIISLNGPKGCALYQETRYIQFI